MTRWLSLPVEQIPDIVNPWVFIADNAWSSSFAVRVNMFADYPKLT